MFSAATVSYKTTYYVLQRGDPLQEHLYNYVKMEDKEKVEEDFDRILGELQALLCTDSQNAETKPPG